MKETQAAIYAWACKTFPAARNGDTVAIARRCTEEIEELRWCLDGFAVAVEAGLPWQYRDALYNLADEAADTIITLYTLLSHAGIDAERAVADKMRINRRRKWKIGPDGTGQHE